MLSERLGAEARVRDVRQYRLIASADLRPLIPPGLVIDVTRNIDAWIVTQNSLSERIERGHGANASPKTNGSSKRTIGAQRLGCF